MTEVTILAGAAWGLTGAISMVGVAAVVRVNAILSVDPDMGQMLAMVLAHLAYGLTLGILAAAVPHIG